MSVDEIIGSGSAAGASRAERLSALVARAQTGDQTAWEELLDSQFRRTVEAACHRRVSDRDVLNDAWGKAIENAKLGIDTLEEDQKFDGWFYTIFYRAAIRANQKESRRQKSFPIAASPDDVAGLVGAAPSAEDEVLSEVLFKGRLDRVLRGMPEKQREALLARVETGLVGDALAKELTERLRERLRESGRTDIEVSKAEVSVEAANTNLSRARQWVKHRVAAAWLADKGRMCPNIKELVEGCDVPLPDEVNAKIRRHYKKCLDCHTTMKLYPMTDDQLELFIDKIASSSQIPLTPATISPGTSALPQAASAVVHAVIRHKVAAALLVGGLTVSAAGFAFLKNPDVQVSPPYSSPVTTIDPTPSGPTSDAAGPPAVTLSSPPSGQDSPNPTPINGNIPTGGTGNPPLPASPTVTPPLTPPTPRTQPPTDPPPPDTTPDVPAYQYTAAPNLAGAWFMTFTRTSGTMKNSVEHYIITLKPVDSSRCASASPCYSGRWTNVDAHNEEAADFTVTVSLSEDVIKFSGAEVDYAQKGPQYYEGTAPNDTRIKTIKFTGSWRQSSPSDGDQTATFTLTRK